MIFIVTDHEDELPGIIDLKLRLVNSKAAIIALKGLNPHSKNFEVIDKCIHIFVKPFMDLSTSSIFHLF